MRTPLMGNTIDREARNIIAIQQTQTPLLGEGDNVNVEFQSEF